MNKDLVWKILKNDIETTNLIKTTFQIIFDMEQLDHTNAVLEVLSHGIDKILTELNIPTLFEDINNL